LKNENEIRLAMDKAELTTDEKEKLYKEMVEDAGEEIQQKIKQITQSLEAANNE
jgi:outer membrane lipopolysaccharide assembly protein LptE/RlpB